MPSKIKSSVKGIVKEPIDTIKKGLKTAIKPASAEGTGAVFVGAILSAPIGYLYNKGFEMLVGQFPQLAENTLVVKIIRFSLPLLPIYFVRKFNVPFGNLINGTLLGVFVMQIVMEIWGLVSGKTLKTGTNDSPVATDTESDSYAEF